MIFQKLMKSSLKNKVGNLKQMFAHDVNTQTHELSKHTALTILAVTAASSVGISMYVKSQNSGELNAPPQIQRAWAEIQKNSGSDQTKAMRRQFTDFGSPWRGIIQKAASLRMGLPKGMGQHGERTVFQKAREFFRIGSTENTPYKVISKRTANLSTRPPMPPPPMAVPGEYTTISELALNRPVPKFSYLRSMKESSLMTSKVMPGGKDLPLFHGLEVVGNKAGVFPAQVEDRAATLLKKIKMGVIGNQLSQSSNPIGSVGVITRSNVHMVFRQDVYTATYGQYRYVPGKSLASEQLGTFRGYISPVGAKTFPGRTPTPTRNVQGTMVPNYDEMVATPTAVTGVWSKSDPESIRTGKELARRLGVPAHVVQDRTTIQAMFPEQWNNATATTESSMAAVRRIRAPIATIDSSTHVVLNAHETKIGHTKIGNAKTPSHLFKDLI